MYEQKQENCCQDFAEYTRYLFVDVAQARAIASGARPARRAVFRKTHGVVHGSMRLYSNRPQGIRHGIFDANEHFLWIRFSSDVAPTDSDATNGTVGIGMKLFGVRPPT